jgi:F-type H+-transporting ATPase subunit b
MAFPLLAADGPLDFQWMPALTSLVVFTIFFLVLKAKVWPGILKGLDDRQDKIRQEIESAEEARAKADAALKEYEDSLASARQEAAATIAQAKADAKAVADDLRARNETELNEMKERAARDINAAKRAAITELHSEAASLAADIATKILKREISADDQRQLVEESLQQLANVERN